MVNIKKHYNLKVISFIVIVVFSVTTIAYGIDLSNKRHLRPPILTNSTAGEQKLKDELIRELRDKVNSYNSELESDSIDMIHRIIDDLGVPRDVVLEVLIYAMQNARNSYYWIQPRIESVLDDRPDLLPRMLDIKSKRSEDILISVLQKHPEAINHIISYVKLKEDLSLIDFLVSKVIFSFIGNDIEDRLRLILNGFDFQKEYFKEAIEMISLKDTNEIHGWNGGFIYAGELFLIFIMESAIHDDSDFSPKAKAGKAIYSILTDEDYDSNKKRILDFFINRNSELEKMFKFFDKYKIDCHYNIMKNFFKKMDVFFLNFILKIDEEEVFRYRKSKKIIKVLLEEYDTRYEVIKNVLMYIYHIDSIIKTFSLDEDSFVDFLEKLLEEYKKGSVGKKLLISNLKGEYKDYCRRSLKDMFNMSDMDDSFFDFLESNQLMLYVLNLGSVRSIINKEVYSDTFLKIYQSLNKLLELKDVVKFNKWLYTESYWNKEAYENLLKAGYSPLLWDKGIVKTSGGITVEVKFDFFRDSYCGVGISSCYNSLTGTHKEMPLMIALETPALFLRVYNSNKMINRAVLNLTPKGIVVSKLYPPGDSSDKIVFEVLADLLYRDWIPSLLMNSHSVGFIPAQIYCKEESVTSETNYTISDKHTLDGDVNANGPEIINRIKFNTNFFITKERLPERNFNINNLNDTVRREL